MESVSSEVVRDTKSVAMKNKWSKGKLLEAVVVLLIFVAHVWGFWDYDGIVVLMDEFGYWEHAASMAGYDWTGVMVSAPWYGWGYSLLLLPLFWVCENMSTMYHMAILMNGCMMVGVYFIAKKLSGKLCNKMSYGESVLAAAVVSLYSAYLGQSKVAFAEIAVYFSFWILVYCFVNMLETKKKIWFLLTSVFAGVTYVMHNRMIVVFIALGMVAVLMLILKSIDWKEFLCLLVPMAIIYLLNDQIREMLQSNIQITTNLQFGVNDIAGRKWRFRLLSNMEGILTAIKTALGELVYLGLSTFLVGSIGLVAVLINLKNEVKRAVKDNRLYIYLFILLNFLGEWAISTLVNMPMKEQIADAAQSFFYYGRYIDAVIGIIILIGILEILHGAGLTKAVNIIFSMVTLVAFSYITYKHTLLSENMATNLFCIPGIWYISVFEDENIFKLTQQLLIPISMIGLLSVLVIMKKSMGKVALVLAAVLYLIVGLSYNESYITKIHGEQGEIFTWMEKYCESDEVYYLEGSYRAQYFLQASSVDKRVKAVRPEEIAEKEDAFLVTETPVYLENLHECMRGATFWLYLTEGDVYERLKNENVLNMKQNQWLIDGKDIELQGFHEPEEGGWAWMKENKASITGNLEKDSYNVTLSMGPTIAISKLPYESYKVEVFVNDEYITEILITEEQDQMEISFTLDEKYIQTGRNRIDFYAEKLWSPSEYGVEDNRELGISVSEVLFQQIE